MSSPDFSTLETPCYVCDEALLENNLKILARLQQASGISILLALKGYAMWSTFGLVGRYLQGCAASGLHEAQLAREEMGKEVHTYSPAFKATQIAAIARLSDHLIFNTPAQFQRFSALAKQANPNIQFSLRINPETSFAPVTLYDPCGPCSRLGTTLAQLKDAPPKGLDGLHCHALCEEDSYAFAKVLAVIEAKFGQWLDRVHILNLGGGHHLTRADYNLAHLIETLAQFKRRFPHLQLYLEPGEAVAWQSGYLVSSVLDIMKNEVDIAILDTSAEAHMPDTLNMPYRAQVRNAGAAHEKPYTYRLTGNTCLAGDIMGDYSFAQALSLGDKIIFEDQLHYSFVKNTTFNGINLPGLALWTRKNQFQPVKQFGYASYKERLS